MGEAVGYLACAVIGVLLVTYATPLIAGLQRSNEWVYRKLPGSIRSPLMKRSNRWHGAMHLLVALGGMMLAVVGLIGFFFSL